MSSFYLTSQPTTATTSCQRYTNTVKLAYNGQVEIGEIYAYKFRIYRISKPDVREIDPRHIVQAHLALMCYASLSYVNYKTFLLKTTYSRNFYHTDSSNENKSWYNIDTNETQH